MTPTLRPQPPLGRAIALLTAVVVLVAGSLVFGVSPAGAKQECVPTPDYPCPPPEPEPLSVVCTLSVQAARVNTRVFAAVSGVPPGLLIQITFNGVVVAQAVSTADGVGQQALGGSSELAAALPRHGRNAPAQVTGGALLSFLVPAAAAGTYSVRAIGAGFNADCGAFTILAAAGGGGRGGFAFTGLNVALLLALALACLVVGRALLQASRERKRRRQASAPAHAERELTRR